MFNTKSVFFGGETNVKLNAISGGIVKNHASSYFMRFHLKSTTAEKLLSPEPHRMRYTGRINVEVLQLVIVGEMEVVAEIIDLPDK